MVRDVKKGKLLLPEFQRDFKWPLENTVTLFDSINRNLFIGSLIVARPKFTLAVKDFDLRPRKKGFHKPKPRQMSEKDFEIEKVDTLLDGQQRVTSIYRAIEGIDKIYYLLESIETLRTPEYWDSKIVCENIEDYVFDVSATKPENTTVLENHHIFFDVKTLANLDLDDEEFFEGFIKDQIQNYSESDQKIIKKFSYRLRKDFAAQVLRKDKLLSVQLLDMPLEKFCLFFERSNSKGITLSFVDIINAKAYIHFKLSASIQQSDKDHQNFRKNLAPTLLRYINWLETGGVKKGEVLENLTGLHLQKNWNICAKDLSSIQDWLKDNFGLFNPEKLVHRTMFFPVLAFYQHLSSKEFTAASSRQLSQLKLWFYASLITGRYGGGGHGSTNVVLKTDCDNLKNLAEGVDLPTAFWQSLRLRLDFDDLLGNDNPDGGVFSALSYYSYTKDKPLNFENNAHVNHGENKTPEKHHFFPQNYVKETCGQKSKAYEYVDSVLNIVRINKISNIKIADRAPSIYLNDLLAGNGDLEKCLQSHKIGEYKKLITGKFDNDFMSFLESRHQSFKPLIESLERALEMASKGKDFSL